MNKPHWLIDDEYKYVDTSKSGDAQDLTDVSELDNFKQVKSAFLDNYNYAVTQSQRSIIDEFWGISDMKNSEELRKLFLKMYDL